MFHKASHKVFTLKPLVFTFQPEREREREREGGGGRVFLPFLKITFYFNRNFPKQENIFCRQQVKLFHALKNFLDVFYVVYWWPFVAKLKDVCLQRYCNSLSQVISSAFSKISEKNFFSKLQWVRPLHF